MSGFPVTLQMLIDRFASLPGIGKKSAQRLAFHILALSDEDAEAFVNAINQARMSIHRCPICRNLTDNDLCPVCADEKRNRRQICVVSEPQDVASIEHGHEYTGVYHVLHGVLSPMNRVGPHDICIDELVQRVADGGVDEVIMATNPDAEGDTTAAYIAKLLRPYDVRVTRLARGLPTDQRLQFSDDATLVSALANRGEM